MRTVGVVLCLCGTLIVGLMSWMRAGGPAVVEAAAIDVQPVPATTPDPQPVVVLEWEGAPARVAPPPVEVALAEEQPERTEPASEQDLLRWIEDLRDDEVNWNATRSAYALWRHVKQAKPLLMAALRSPDAQQRGLAAYILTDLELTDPAEKHALVDVLAESYEHPRFFPREVRNGTGEVTRTYSLAVSLEDNAYIAFRINAEYRDMARPVIERVWSHADDERGRDAGYLLAHDRLGRTRFAIAQRAVDHLVDNEVEGDAVISLRTLTRLGPEAIPVVLDALPGRDSQAQQLLGHWLSYFAPEHRLASRLSGKQIGKLGFWYGDWVLAEWERCEWERVPPVPETELATMDEEFPAGESGEY